MSILTNDFHSAKEKVGKLEHDLFPAKISFYNFLRENDPAGRVNYQIFGWGDTGKPLARRYALPVEEYRLDLTISTDSEITFTAIDGEDSLFFMMPVEYVENTTWAEKILSDMESDANLVRNELIEMAGADEVDKVDIFTELYVVHDDPNPAFNEILRVSYRKKQYLETGWLNELTVRYRNRYGSTHYFSRVTNGLYSNIPFHLIERGYSAEWEKYRTLNAKDRMARLQSLMP